MEASSARTDIVTLESSDFGPSNAVPAPGRRRGKRALETSGPVIHVTSHLTEREPVTQAEIELVLAFLRDSIADIMRGET